jgi:hypothetical protein
MPSVSASGCRLGIGQLMYVFIIKQCAAFANGGNIEIFFLQGHEPGAFRFHCMLRFQQLNSNYDNGFTLQDVLLAVPPKKKVGHSQSTYLFWGDDPEQIGQFATMLMHLGHQELRSVVEIDDNASLVSSAESESMMLDKDVHVPFREMYV